MTNEKQNLKDEFKDMSTLRKLLFVGIPILGGIRLLARKVRDRSITRDDALLTIFLFCVGWGLFIGGTLVG